MSSLLSCPHCGCQERQVKNGTSAGIARFKCQKCNKTYATTPPRPKGYEEQTRLQAVKMYIDGNNFRRIARLLGVNHQSVINWVNAHHQRLSQQRAGFPHQNPAPAAKDTLDKDIAQQTAALKTLEADEIFTFVGQKKTKSI